MSDYTGPGIYEFLPMNADSMSVNVWGASTTAGADIKLYARSSSSTNTQFEIVAAGGTQGKPEIGDREYHIISVQTGLYLCAHDNGSPVTMELKPPKDVSIRWKIKYAGNGAYYIQSVDGKNELNVKGSGTDSGTQVIMYQHADAANAQFKLKSAS